MEEGDLVVLIREHLYGPKGCPDGWATSRDVSIVRRILKIRPAETLESVSHAILGIGEMRGQGNWFRANEQLTMRIFYARTRLGQPYYQIAQGRYYKAQKRGRMQPSALGAILQEIANRGMPTNESH